MTESSTTPLRGGATRVMATGSRDTEEKYNNGDADTGAEDEQTMTASEGPIR